MPEYVVRATNLGDLDPFTRGYLECAEWCGLDEAEREAFELSTAPAWSQKSLDRAREDCESFQQQFGAEIEGNEGNAGHDFFLTRNRHGAGFWDGDWPLEVGRKLTEMSHPYGETHVWFDNGVLEIE